MNINMDISVKKIDLIEWLTRLQDERLLEKIDHLRKESIQESYQSRTPGTLEELQEKLDRSEEDIKAGRVYSQQEVEQFFKKKFNG